MDEFSSRHHLFMSVTFAGFRSVPKKIARTKDRLAGVSDLQKG